MDHLMGQPSLNTTSVGPTCTVTISAGKYCIQCAVFLVISPPLVQLCKFLPASPQLLLVIPLKNCKV